MFDKMDIICSRNFRHYLFRRMKGCWRTFVLAKKKKVCFCASADFVSSYPIEVVIPVIDKDADVLPEVVDSIRENILHPVMQIYFITNKNSTKVAEIAKQKGCVVVDEEGLLGFAPKEVDYKVNGKNYAGWLYQQFLKMAWCYRSKTENYLLLDADTIFLKKVSFENKGKFLLETSLEKHSLYAKMIERIGLPYVSKLSFVCHHMMVNSRWMKQMLEEISMKNQMVWHQAIIQKIDRSEPAGFSEYDTYGNYVLFHYPELLSFKFFDNISMKRTDYSAKNKKFYARFFETLSLHSYNL